MTDTNTQPDDNQATLMKQADELAAGIINGFAAVGAPLNVALQALMNAAGMVAEHTPQDVPMQEWRMHNSACWRGVADDIQRSAGVVMQ